MAKIQLDACDNVTDSQRKTLRKDDTTNDFFTAVTDPEVLAKLCEIKDSITDEFCTKNASETISALKLVKLDNATNVSIAESDSTCENATVFGIARTAANAGSNLDIVQFGKFYDTSFNFPVNTQLFLDANGNITDIAPTTGFLTRIGYSGGPGLVIIDIDDPIQL